MLAATTAPITAQPGLIERTLAERADVIGDKVRIEVGDSSVVGLHRPTQQTESRGAVLILHAPESTVDDPTLIRPLRLGLADAGWDTLTVQLPTRLLSESTQQWLARHEQLAPMIAGASQWLQERGHLNQVVVGVGVSGWAVLSFAAKQATGIIQALVLVSTPILPASDAAEQLSATKLPVLDLIAERDLEPVLGSSPLKQQLAKQNTGYSQRAVPAATSGFVGLEESAVSMVRTWLAANAVDRELETPGRNP